MKIQIRWDTESDANHPGWLVQMPAGGKLAGEWMAPAPGNNEGPDADSAQLDEMARATVEWHGGIEVESATAKVVS